MNPEKLEHFRLLLIEQLREHNILIQEDQAAAVEIADDGAKDSLDMGQLDFYRELSLKLGENESQLVADIDQALFRIKEGSYGICARCGNVIEERRLEAMPWVRYDAKCQSLIEQQNGQDHTPSL
ncbi:MAG TPA: TraR/DksA family transcriptional regulator [Pyrinomonadaceae bacterium]|jgi:DnaK suppressor protein